MSIEIPKLTPVNEKPEVKPIIKNKKYYFKKYGVPILLGIMAFLIVVAIGLFLKRGG